MQGKCYNKDLNVNGWSDGVNNTGSRGWQTDWFRSSILKPWNYINISTLISSTFWTKNYGECSLSWGYPWYSDSAIVWCYLMSRPSNHIWNNLRCMSKGYHNLNCSYSSLRSSQLLMSNRCSCWNHKKMILSYHHRNCNFKIVLIENWIERRQIRQSNSNSRSKHKFKITKRL